MFSNFKNAFIRRPQFTIKTPDAVLDMISKGLPAGMRYVHDHDGLCRLECEGEFNIVPNKLNLPEDARSIFEKKENVTMEDILAYAYNSQKRIELLPDDEGYYIVNGEKIKKSEFVAAPLKEIEFTEGNIYIVPPSFPKPFPLKLSGNGYSLDVMVQRQPINSMDEIKFASVGDSLMTISYTLNLTNDTVQFNISTNESNRAKDILVSKEIFNAAVLGNGMINGSPIPFIQENQDKVVAEETLAFWHKVVELEETLSITFNMDQEITIDDIKLIDALHRSFVEKKPFKTYLTDLKLSGIGDFNEANEKARQTPVGKEIMFEFTEEISAELFDVKLKLFSIACIFDCVVSEIKLPENEQTGEFCIKLIPADGKRMFSSKQYYLTKDMVEKIRSDKHVEEYHDAEELKEY